MRWILCILILVSCGGLQQRSEKRHQWMEQNGKLKILSTTAMINDLAQNIAKEHADTITLIQGNLDPHSYQLVKGDDELLSKADLIFQNGLGLEHGASLEHYLQKNKRAVSLGEEIQNKYPDRIFYVHHQVDPHIWMDLSLFALAIPIIEAALSEKDPLHAPMYKKNAADLTAELQKVHADIFAKLHEIPAAKRFLVTSHDAFNYFTKAYLAEPEEVEKGTWQMRFQAPEGLAPDSQLSSNDIQLIINHLKDYSIEVIFPESNVSQDSIRKIMDAGSELGLHVKIAADPLYGDAMGPPGSPGDTYPKMLEHNADIINKYLK